jgi:hypothetical protein
MKSDRLLILACAAILVLAFLFSCSNQLAGGDVTETGNARVFGKIVDTLGNGKKNVHVQLLPSYFDPVRDGIPLDSLSTTTDENGNYVINTSIIGNYNIEAINPLSGDRALIRNIDIQLNDTINNETAILQQTGTIKIVLSSDSISDAVYAYIPGTTRFGTIDGRIVIIDSVPAGSFTTLCYVDKIDTAENRTFKKEFSVISGCTAIITDNQSWLFSRKLYFNTTSSGAAVINNVYSFPVLIRLSTDNFDFSQAKKGGEDIRFAKADGTQLPCEIERWDPSIGRVEIWVKMDTVYGNTDNQYIVMYWGNTLAQAVSNSAAVFDTSTGFQGVWHLNETGSASVKDATSNHFDGTPSDTAPAGAEGAIGSCKSFNGSSNYIRMKGTAAGKLNFQEDGTYTISAWVYTDTLDIGYHAIAGKSNEQYFLGLKRANPDSTMRWEFVEYRDKSGFQITQDFPSAKTWTYLVGVRKGTTQYLYVNGTLVDSTIEFSPNSASRNTADDVTIGGFLSVPVYSYEEKCSFLGKIDEVRISNTANDGDWSRLCFMNQKEQDVLVKW